MQNKRLGIIAVAMFPLVVISFAFKSGETNFNLGETYGPPGPSDVLEEPQVEPVTVRVLMNGEVEEMDLEEYVIGVVAGEMPASFDIEALKAQAVASRTFALYRKNRSSGVYDLTNGTSSQVYIDEAAMRSKWGDEYEKYYDKIRNAVEETRDKVITYDGEIIEAFYFAMSSGSTNESGTVFGESRDYLRSVASEYDTSVLNGYNGEVILSTQDFISKLGLSCEEVSIGEVKRSESHYVENVQVCGVDIKGTVMRANLGLRSTDFDIEVGDVVRIHTRGYGHGVGMSQYGANGYAAAGYSYEDIIKHYYTGVEISNLKDV